MNHALTRVTRFAATVLTVAALAAWCPAGAQATVGRGLVDFQLDALVSDPTVKEDLIVEVSSQLQAAWVRTSVNWPALEPERGVYDARVLGNLDYLVAALEERGVKLLVTVSATPRWASDRRFWDSPPFDMAKGYRDFYPIRSDALPDLQRTMQFLASRYAGRVEAYQCWNEPNLWPYLYPQRTVNDEYFAPRLYLAMLKAFRNGLQDAGSTAKVVAGATAPIGLNDKYRTSPQKFARFLEESGAADYFDAYSHHPYTPGGSRNTAPDQAPNDSTTTVTLYNLRTLLRLFPGKPFYLTEYGYSTQPGPSFGGFSVTPVQQASYLRKAYAYAGRYSQVKVLFWLCVKDFDPPEAPNYAVFTGLRQADGDRKLSWFAFAGRNRLTIEAPRTARYGALIRVTGQLSNASVGTLAGRSLVLQSRKLSGGAWRKVSTVKTRSGGKYRFTIKPGGSRVYRVVWQGVKTSATRKVKVYL